ncbi:MAG: hypothetical protein KatS3mg121_1025 [Gammaproteobacteria bacterium]|nr:MAG: hypothetical protein KatS3mg121_1025 [Gammaproteobacteria bacterium]
MNPPLRHAAGLTPRWLALSLLCLALVFVDDRYAVLDGVRSGAERLLIEPLRAAAAWPGRLLGAAGEALAERRRLLAENARLRAENLRLRARLLEMAALEAENARLRALLAAAERLGKRVRVAEVLAVRQDYQHQQLVIDKGAADGVHVGQAVLDAEGVMGQVIGVADHSATVLLISDPEHRIPVQNIRNGVRSLAQGKGDPRELDLLYVTPHTDLRPGDLLVTSGLGGRFPANYPVARVDRFEAVPGDPYARVTARPLAGLDRSREVILVWPETRR